LAVLLCYRHADERFWPTAPHGAFQAAPQGVDRDTLDEPPS